MQNQRYAVLYMPYFIFYIATRNKTALFLLLFSDKDFYDIFPDCKLLALVQTDKNNNIMNLQLFLTIPMILSLIGIISQKPCNHNALTKFSLDPR